jgi:hypothetical protein
MFFRSWCANETSLQRNNTILNFGGRKSKTQVFINVINVFDLRATVDPDHCKATHKVS